MAWNSVTRHSAVWCVGQQQLNSRRNSLSLVLPQTCRMSLDLTFRSTSLTWDDKSLCELTVMSATCKKLKASPKQVSTSMQHSTKTIMQTSEWWQLNQCCAVTKLRISTSQLNWFTPYGWSYAASRIETLVADTPWTSSSFRSTSSSKPRGMMR